MSCLSNFTSMFRLLQKPYQKNFLVFIDYNIIILGRNEVTIYKPDFLSMRKSDYFRFSSLSIFPTMPPLTQ